MTPFDMTCFGINSMLDGGICELGDGLLVSLFRVPRARISSTMEGGGGLRVVFGGSPSTHRHIDSSKELRVVPLSIFSGLHRDSFFRSVKIKGNVHTVNCSLFLIIFLV